MLRLLHPFMPFITEELWQRLLAASTGEHPVSISLSAYPQPKESLAHEAQARNFGKLQQIVTAARELRADNKLDPKSTAPATLYLRDFTFSDDDLAALSALSRLDITPRPGTISEQKGIVRTAPEFDLEIHAAAQNGALSPEARARILKEMAAQERAIENSQRQLNDATFLRRAPEKVVASLRAKLAENELQLAKNRKLLEGLG